MILVSALSRRASNIFLKDRPRDELDVGKGAAPDEGEPGGEDEQAKPLLDTAQTNLEGIPVGCEIVEDEDKDKDKDKDKDGDEDEDEDRDEMERDSDDEEDSDEGDEDGEVDDTSKYAEL